jgi:hypothetical protein
MFNVCCDGLGYQSGRAGLRERNEKEAVMPDGTRRHALVGKMEGHGPRFSPKEG